ncbi:hypothetical protein ACU4GA_32590 [Methylobacterium oryzae CBMB20]
MRDLVLATPGPGDRLRRAVRIPSLTTPARRVGAGLAATLAVAVSAAGLVASGALERSVVARDVETPLSAEAVRSAPRGAKVAAAADCFACHTARGGAPGRGAAPGDALRHDPRHQHLAEPTGHRRLEPRRLPPRPCATGSRRAAATSTRRCPTPRIAA